jgi:hypothetical protein
MMPRLEPEDIDFPDPQSPLPDFKGDCIADQWKIFCHDQPHLSDLVQSRGWYAPGVFRGFLLGYSAVRAALSRS